MSASCHREVGVCLVSQRRSGCLSCVTEEKWVSVSCHSVFLPRVTECVSVSCHRVCFCLVSQRRIGCLVVSQSEFLSRVTEEKWVSVSCHRGEVGVCLVSQRRSGCLSRVTEEKWVSVSCHRGEVGVCLVSQCVSASCHRGEVGVGLGGRRWRRRGGPERGRRRSPRRRAGQPGAGEPRSADEAAPALLHPLLGARHHLAPQEVHRAEALQQHRKIQGGEQRAQSAAGNKKTNKKIGHKICIIVIIFVILYRCSIIMKLI